MRKCDNCWEGVRKLTMGLRLNLAMAQSDVILPLGDSPSKTRTGDRIDAAKQIRGCFRA
jgi:hypothetical protein